MNNKYETVIAYACRVATKSERPLNKTKLFKVIWLADILNYAKTGKTIVNDVIKRLPYGPVHDNVENKVRATENKKWINSHPTGGVYGNQILYTSDNDIPLNGILTPTEVDAINEAINFIKDKTASEISEFSHSFDAWKQHDTGDEIKPAEFLIQDAPFNDKDEEFIRENAHLF